MIQPPHLSLAILVIAAVVGFVFAAWVADHTRY